MTSTRFFSDFGPFFQNLCLQNLYRLSANLRCFKTPLTTCVDVISGSPHTPPLSHSSPLSLVLSDTRSAFGLMSAVTSKSPATSVAAAESDFLEEG